MKMERVPEEQDPRLSYGLQHMCTNRYINHLHIHISAQREERRGEEKGEEGRGGEGEERKRGEGSGGEGGETDHWVDSTNGMFFV